MKLPKLSQDDLNRLDELERNGQHHLVIEPLKKLFKYHVSSLNKDLAKETLYRISRSSNHIVEQLIYPSIETKLLLSLNINKTEVKSDISFDYSNHLAYIKSLAISSEWESFRALLPTWRSVIKFILIDLTSLLENLLGPSVENLAKALGMRIDIPKQSIGALVSSFRLKATKELALADIYSLLISTSYPDPTQLASSEEYSYFLNRLSMLEIEAGNIVFSIKNKDASQIQYYWSMEISDIIDVSRFKAAFQYKPHKSPFQGLLPSKQKYPCVVFFSELCSFYDKITSILVSLDERNISIEKALIAELLSQSYFLGLLGRTLELASGEFFSHVLNLLLLNSPCFDDHEAVTKCCNRGLAHAESLKLDRLIAFYSLHTAISLTLIPQDTIDINRANSVSLLKSRVMSFISPDTEACDEMLELILQAYCYMMELEFNTLTPLHPSAPSAAARLLIYGNEILCNINALAKKMPSNVYISLLSILNKSYIDWASACNRAKTCVFQYDTAFIQSLINKLKATIQPQTYNRILSIIHLISLRTAMLSLCGPILEISNMAKIFDSYLFNESSFIFNPEHIFSNKHGTLMAVKALTMILQEKPHQITCWNNQLLANAFSSDAYVSHAYSILSLYYLFLALFSSPSNASSAHLKMADDCATRSLGVLPWNNNQLATYSLLLLRYNNWLDRKISTSALMELLDKVDPISPITELRTTSYLALKTKARILLLHAANIHKPVSSAISCLQAVLRIHPSEAPSWYLLAESYAKNRQYSAAFKGYAKVLMLKINRTQSLGTLIIKMASALFNNNSFGLCLKFISPLISDLDAFDWEFIEENNPLDLSSYSINLSLDELKQCKLIWFASSLELAEALFEEGEINSLFILLSYMYEMVSFIIEMDKKALIDQLISITIEIFDSRAIELYEEENPAFIKSLCELIEHKTITTAPIVLYGQTLNVDNIAQTNPNREWFSGLIELIVSHSESIIDSADIMSKLYLSKIYISLQKISDSKALLNMMNSLILLDVRKIIDTEALAPFIFTLIRGLCLFSIEKQDRDAASSIWLIAAKWLLTKGMLSLAQHCLFIALEMSSSQEQNAEIFAVIALLAFGVRQYEQCQDFALKSKLANPYLADVDFFVNYFKSLESS